MTRGPESDTEQAWRDITAAVQLLLEDVADSGEHFGLLALPESAPSFVADMRSHGAEGLRSPVAVDWAMPNTKLRGLIREHLNGIAAATELVQHARVLDLPALPRFYEEARLAAAKAWTVSMPLARGCAVAGQVGATDLEDADTIAPPSQLAEPDDDGWGPVVPTAEAEALERENLRLQVEQRREQLASSFTRAEAAALLGVSAQTVSDMVAEHRLVGLKDGRSWRLPAWQFTPDLAEPVLPEVGRLAQEFPGGVVSLSRWMSRPNDNFDGRTPAQEMTRDSDRVIAVIRSLTAA
ncbi:excisionase family DNA binding protein [Rhodococcus sp. PvR044]|uniref:helix-turn-helix domain-containing protein n=1 Tax=Rhodococcus sp. PvR044 TaxID=3156402 RepID=UPI0033949846